MDVRYGDEREEENGAREDREPEEGRERVIGEEIGCSAAVGGGVRDVHLGRGGKWQSEQFLKSADYL